VNRKENIDNFKIPANYFDEFENHLFKKLNEEILPKNTGFKIPVGYFNTLDIKIKRKNNSKSKEEKKIPVVSIKTFMYAASIAAITILFFSVLNDMNHIHTLKEVEISSIEIFINEGNIQLNQYEITSLFTEEIINNMTNGENRLSGNQLEDYLLENINDLNALLKY
jgi:hypothetical protein